MTEKEFLEQNTDAEFVGIIRVGSRGVNNFFTDREKYYKFRDKAWDSGHDMYCSVLRGK